ncbi:MAG: alpha-amylase family glycosyl hydrolase, partial [Gammaproteobacteria bacterium]
MSKKLLLAASVAACFAAPMRASAAPGQVYVNLFEWKYPDIAEECKQWLKPAGFSAVQISVPSEAKGNTNSWWERYQPVSYKLDSRLGTRQQLADMVATCRTAGIAIYADVVIQHMANGTGTGESGSFYNSANNYPGPGYTSADFHPLCTVNDSSAQNVHDCWLDGSLPDLRTESSKVRTILSNYLKDLLSLGVAGFRVDTAKHVPADDLKIIIDGAGNVNAATAAAFGITKPWVTGEDFGGFGPIGEAERSVYFSIGTMNEFKYKDVLRDAFTRNGASISQLASL